MTVLLRRVRAHSAAQRRLCELVEVRCALSDALRDGGDAAAALAEAESAMGIAAAAVAAGAGSADSARCLAAAARAHMSMPSDELDTSEQAGHALRAAHAAVAAAPADAAALRCRAQVLLFAGDAGGAEEDARTAAALLTAQLGAGHADAAEADTQLANAMDAGGCESTATADLRFAALERLRGALGGGHPRTVRAELDAIAAGVSPGDGGPGAALRAALCSLDAAFAGAAHPLVIRAHRLAGEVARDPLDAAAEYAAAANMAEVLYGPEHPETLNLRLQTHMADGEPPLGVAQDAVPPTTMSELGREYFATRDPLEELPEWRALPGAQSLPSSHAGVAAARPAVPAADSSEGSWLPGTGVAATTVAARGARPAVTTADSSAGSWLPAAGPAAQEEGMAGRLPAARRHLPSHACETVALPAATAAESSAGSWLPCSGTTAAAVVTARPMAGAPPQERSRSAAGAAAEGESDAGSCEWYVRLAA